MATKYHRMGREPSASRSTLWPRLELEVFQDTERVESNMPEPDPEWRAVDGHGHGHFYDAKTSRFPTLEWVVLPCTMGHGDDCTSEGYYRCPLCEERVSPGTRMPNPVLIAGPVTYKLTTHTAEGSTTYAFGPEQFEALGAAIEAVVGETLAAHIIERTFDRHA